jgi:hypothetical protein
VTVQVTTGMTPETYRWLSEEITRKQLAHIISSDHDMTKIDLLLQALLLSLDTVLKHAAGTYTHSTVYHALLECGVPLCGPFPFEKNPLLEDAVHADPRS